MTDKNLPTLTAGAAVQLADLFISRQGADTDDKYVTGTQLKAALVTTANQLTIDAAGTVYSLTATAAKVDFGTTDPAITINAAGTYIIVADCVLNYNGATFAAVRTATMKLRRTNNTAADLSDGTRAIKTEVVTTISGTLAQVTITSIYTTANTNDAIELWGSLDVIPTAGSLDVVSASVRAVRLQL